MGEDRRVQQERPDWSALSAMVADLRKTTARIPEIQREMLAVTGSAWSDDGLVKAVVGPRGHLLELEIDPQVYRTPNSKALAATIVQTVRAAVEEAGEKSRRLMEESLPADMRPARLGGTDLTTFVGSHDADVRVVKDDDDE
jgi:DNA-binding protein YbaB